MQNSKRFFFFYSFAWSSRKCFVSVWSGSYSTITPLPRNLPSPFFQFPLLSFASASQTISLLGQNRFPLLPRLGGNDPSKDCCQMLVGVASF